jgi:hypothetical protein
MRQRLQHLYVDFVDKDSSCLHFTPVRVNKKNEVQDTAALSSRG